MKLRKANLRGLDFDLSVDFTNGSGRIQDVTAIFGGNQSGKSVLARFISICYGESALGESVIPLWFDKYDGEVDFEVNGIVTTTVFRQGKFLQKANLPELVPVNRQLPEKLFDALLFFNSYTRTSMLAMNENRGMPTSIGLTYQLFSDFYNHQIRNSVILVDDFDLGLDRKNAGKLLEKLISKGLEGDNQLVITTRNALLLDSLDSGITRMLPSGSESVVEEAVRRAVSAV